MIIGTSTIDCVCVAYYSYCYSFFIIKATGTVSAPREPCMSCRSGTLYFSLVYVIFLHK